MDFGGVESHHARLGIVANNEADLNSPDSRIGIGGRQDLSVGRCGNPACPTQNENTAGYAATCVTGGCVDVRVFAYVFAR